MEKTNSAEIGSEFWIEETLIKSTNIIPKWLNFGGNIVFTTTGRGSFLLMLESIKEKVISNRVLLPAYICESVIQPFIEKGYDYIFYDIDLELSPIIRLDIKDIGIFVHCAYFGFITNKKLDNQIETMKANGTIIVEDVTHSMFSKYDRYSQNDFFIGSIRKWFGTPGGGFLSTNKYELKKPKLNDNKFIGLRTKALILKKKYINSGDENLKYRYLSAFSKAEKVIDDNINVYQLDELSYSIINNVKDKDLINKRRMNYLYLLEKLERINDIEVIFNYLGEGICPMFFPIKIKQNRDIVKLKLVKEKIYCPIHWPVPEQIKTNNFSNSFEMYNHIISIPCDQRYNIADMEKIILALREIFNNK